jgi:hypothetical protein
VRYLQQRAGGATWQRSTAGSPEPLVRQCMEGVGTPRT